MAVQHTNRKFHECRPAALLRPAVPQAIVAGLLGLTAVLLVAGAGVAQAQDAKAKAAQIITGRGCAACHYVPGIPQAVGTLGPSLKGLGTRARIAGGKLENTPENLRDWLTNPKAVLPSTMMPNLGLSDEEISTLIDFFKTL